MPYRPNTEPDGFIPRWGSGAIQTYTPNQTDSFPGGTQVPYRPIHRTSRIHSQVGLRSHTDLYTEPDGFIPRWDSGAIRTYTPNQTDSFPGGTQVPYRPNTEPAGFIPRWGSGAMPYRPNTEPAGFIPRWLQLSSRYVFQCYLPRGQILGPPSYNRSWQG